MKTHRKQRLLFILAILIAVSVAVGLSLFALKSNINHFYTPTELSEGNAPTGQTIRAGGLVVEGSVSRNDETLYARFDITDGVAKVTVTYKGILPDLFREGQGIVAIGKLNGSGVVEAEKVLAKHDENYMPPEVADALKKAADSGKIPHYKESTDTK